MRTSRFALAMFAPLVLFAGCGSKSPNVPAEGTAFNADGSALIGSIFFIPTNDPDRYAKQHSLFPAGIIDEAGKFALALKADVPGIPPGEYRAIIVARTNGGVPDRYSDYTTSPWTVTVPRGGKNDIVLRIEN